LAPDPLVTRLSWWRKTISSLPKEVGKGFNPLIILVAWEVQKHRNDCVFDNCRPGILENSTFIIITILGIVAVSPASQAHLVYLSF
jgi:hypothetical protein